MVILLNHKRWLGEVIMKNNLSELVFILDESGSMYANSISGKAFLTSSANFTASEWLFVCATDKRNSCF